MTTAKGAPRRKRAVHGPEGATKKPTATAAAAAAKKKKLTVAAKRKHVRELAKAGRWNEIERLYGKKIVTKAKTYVATLDGPKKTPLEIAHEILIKNGYLPSGPATSARRPLPAPAAHQTTAGSGTRDCRPESTAVVALDSPVKLTKEQQQLIETRRQEALARRRRVQQAARPHVHPSPAVIEPSRPFDEGLRQMRQATAPKQEQQHLVPGQVSRLGSSRPAGHPKAPTQCVVIEERCARTGSVDETKHARPESFWDDLEAAAEIVQWENEHMAEAALEQQQQLPATQIAPDEECGDTYQSSHHRRESPAVDNRPPTVISFSQELLAAADIVQWEKERERDVPEVPASSQPGDSSGSDHEPDAPQFQLLPVHITDDVQQPSQTFHESVLRQVSNSRDRPNSTGQQLHPRGPQVDRSSAAVPQPALQQNSAVSASVTKASDVHQLRQTSSHPSRHQHGSPTEFIDKHLLEDKLGFPVLEFLDMMLA
ncbi:unnamed protein product [Hyaloperonospora brassicae]|uniref:Uncharacterized protein n=1 Tax=Hyaloperonospora brassicae TaxID=162125 RepID=A0AAV0T1Y2_HYABA|nr:unnamed protein product [Hyaloperonospora brassicae]